MSAYNLNYTELHARSAFSFLRGCSHPEEIVRTAARLGYRGVALTDHMGFYGSARAHAAALETGVRAHVGLTLDCTGGHHLPLLVRSRQGYQNACRLLTAAHLATARTTASAPVVATLVDLRKLTPAQGAGLVCLTGGHGTRLHHLLLHRRFDDATTHARDLAATFGHGNVYLELNRHLHRGETVLHRHLLELAAHLDLPAVASNAPLFATPGRRPLADAFHALRNHTTLDAGRPFLEPNGERYLKPLPALAELFRDQPDALAATAALAARLEFTLADLGYRFPSYRDPDTGRHLTLTEQQDTLRHAVDAGLRDRCGTVTPALADTVRSELDLIAKLGFPGYFLTVWDITRFARHEGILCQGRGSAANSVVCYALGITNVDPLKHSLVFERFLSENRRSWPDIDIDFPSGDQREKVIQHLYRRFSPHGAAMTANVITYKPRSAFREMSKVLGFPAEVADRFSEVSASPRVEDHRDRDDGAPPSMGELYPSSTVSDLEQTVHRAGVPPGHPRLPALLALYGAVLHLPRHLGQHSGGMVLCDTPLTDIVPLQPAAMPGRTVLQWDKDDCEDLGILKVDLLGLGMLAAMENTIEICAARGTRIDLSKIPLDDPATFDLLCRADTVGTFQVESRAQMATLPIMRPKCFYDVAVEVALIRPGPIVGDLVHPYLNRRTGREKIDHIHPLFEPVLGRTLGVPLFQEQVLQMAMIIAGFTGAEADELRRAMSFRRSDERMERVLTKLRRGMDDKHVTPAIQDKVVAAVQSFALYGFPESHAISFGLLAYASCWLKVHHPAAFYCGVINNQPMGFYSVSTLVRDAKLHGLRILPPCVVESKIDSEPSGPQAQAIRLGLARLRGVRSTTLEHIVEQRRGEPFRDLDDFRRRVPANTKERRILASSGALNQLSGVAHRRHALWEVERPLWENLLVREGDADTDTPPPDSPLAPMAPLERLQADYDLQGHTVGRHPVALWRAAAAKDSNADQDLHTMDARRLLSLRHNAPVRIAGLVICRQRPGTAKGHCFISLEDETGIANAFVPRDTYQKFRYLIASQAFLTVSGRVQVGEGRVVSVYTHDLAPLTFSPDLGRLSHDFH